MRKVTIYSRSGCHLCEDAHATLSNLASTQPGGASFELVEILIDGDPELERLYGDQVPVILIDEKVHDFFRVNPERFLGALSK
jgi:glutaredoxin